MNHCSVQAFLCENKAPLDEFGDANHLQPNIQNVGWSLGNFCPYKCKHCYSASARTAGANMDIKKIDRVIEQLSKNNVATINLGGNEPIFTNGPKIKDTLLPYILKSIRDPVFHTRGKINSREKLDVITNIRYLRNLMKRQKEITSFEMVNK